MKVKLRFSVPSAGITEVEKELPRENLIKSATLCNNSREMWLYLRSNLVHLTILAAKSEGYTNFQPMLQQYSYQHKAPSDPHHTAKGKDEVVKMMPFNANKSIKAWSEGHPHNYKKQLH